MAFWAWTEGYFEPDAINALQATPKKPRPLGGHAVTSGEILSTMADPGVQDAFALWGDYRRFGLPFAGGWAEHPALIVQVLRLFDGEHAKWQEQQNDIRRTQAGS